MIIETADGTTDNMSCAKVDERYYLRNYTANLTFTRNWDYPPREELLTRLNQRLRGIDPDLPINTRYWRDL